MLFVEKVKGMCLFISLADRGAIDLSASQYATHWKNAHCKGKDKENSVVLF